MLVQSKKYYLAQYSNTEKPQYIVTNLKPFQRERQTIWDFEADIVFFFNGSLDGFSSELFKKDELKEIEVSEYIKYKLLG